MNVRRKFGHFEKWETSGVFDPSASVTAFEAEDHVLVAGFRGGGEPLDPEQGCGLVTLPATASPLPGDVDTDEPSQRLSDLTKVQRNSVFASFWDKNSRFFATELDKLDRWGEARRSSVKVVIKELEEQINTLRRDARMDPKVPEKLKLERKKRQLDTRRDRARREYERAAKDIESKEDSLMSEVEKRLQQMVHETPLFSIRWKVQ